MNDIISVILWYDEEISTIMCLKDSSKISNSIHSKTTGRCPFAFSGKTVRKQYVT